MIGYMRVQVDKAACIGTGDCIRIAPGVFEFDADLLSHVKDPDGADADTIMLAARKCPTSAITVEDDLGNRLWPR
jgi:ferredoxin